MAFSNSYGFTLNTLQLIDRALQIINVIDLGSSSAGTNEYSFAKDILNAMLKHWETQGIKLWNRKQATLFTALNQQSYQLGNVSGADRAVNTYISTTTSSNTGSGVTAFDVTSTTGLVMGMNIGLELDNKSRQWGTISSIVGTTINVDFTTTTTSQANNTVVAYAASGALINRPLLVLRATVLDLVNNNQESMMQKIGYDEYFNMPVKNLAGQPNNFYYSRTINNAVSYTGTLYMFPVCSMTSQLVTFTYLDSIEDMIGTTDNFDLPQEWCLALMFNLAVQCAYAYGKFTELQQLEPHAQKLLSQLENFDTDDEPLMIMPDWQSGFNGRGS